MKHSPKHYRLFFGPKSSYYLDMVTQFDEGEKVVFNLFAFLFGPLWMLYRKMYRTFFLFILIFLLEIIIELVILIHLDAEHLATLLTRSSIFLWSWIFGFFGNTFYLRMTNKKISKLLEKYHSTPGINPIIQKSGGTSLLAVGLFLLTIILSGYLLK